VVVVLTSQAYIWYVDKSKRSHDDVERNCYDAINITDGSRLEQVVSIVTQDDFGALISEERVLIDVRAPVEFGAGAAPHSVNAPLLDDEQRRLVGITYKQEGSSAAVALGEALISGALRHKLIERWRSIAKNHPNACFYCARGGLRSTIAQKWLAEAGVDIARIAGGYKALRSFFLERLAHPGNNLKPVLLGGRTGVGKTELLVTLSNGVDLEALANHRGSAFGRHLDEQPSQADFENRLAAQLIKHDRRGATFIIVEDEGKHIGRCYLSAQLADWFASGDMVLLEAPMDERVRRIFAEYVTAAQHIYRRRFGDEAAESRWRADIHKALNRISKRLGGVRTTDITALLDDACRHQRMSGDASRHEAWIERLLREYYDPMYDYQIARKTALIVCRGDCAGVREFLATRYGDG
jgi:tRNA 2-selenouridine synthase